MSDPKIMINQKQIRTLLRKTANKFISVPIAMQLLKLKKRETLEALSYIEANGFIEKSEVDKEYWILSARGKLLIHKVFSREFKVETLRKHIDNLLERTEIVNTLAKFPHCITCIKVIGPYPIDNRSKGVLIAYALNRKQITENQYNEAANKLRKEYKGTFGNIPEYLDYPHKAIKRFLQSRSKVLKLREYSATDIKRLEGHIIFGKEQDSM